MRTENGVGAQHEHKGGPEPCTRGEVVKADSKRTVRSCEDMEKMGVLCSTQKRLIVRELCSSINHCTIIVSSLGLAKEKEAREKYGRREEGREA